MSYAATISFKELEPQDICEFFSQLKESTTKNIEDLAECNFIYSPLFKGYNFSKIDFVLKDVMIEEIKAWARASSIFRYRWWYIKESKLLLVYGMSGKQRELFDCTVDLQNSCDQDYDWSDWDGVEVWKPIVEKWKSMTIDEYLKIDTEREKEDLTHLGLEYYTKSACYKEIWNSIEFTLYDNNRCTHLTLYGHYDFLPIIHFTKRVITCIDEWLFKYEKRHLATDEYTEMWVKQEGHSDGEYI